MIYPNDLLSALYKYNIGTMAGVPCSMLSPLIECIPDFLVATDEAEAMGIALGSTLAGRLGVVLMQNSGLGNAMDVITSFANPYEIPCLMIVSRRGFDRDAGHHKQMGAMTPTLLASLGVYHEFVPHYPERVPQVVDTVLQIIEESSRPAALIIERGVF